MDYWQQTREATDRATDRATDKQQTRQQTREPASAESLVRCRYFLKLLRSRSLSFKAYFDVCFVWLCCARNLLSRCARTPNGCRCTLSGCICTCPGRELKKIRIWCMRTFRGPIDEVISFASQNGMPFELRGFQPDQPRWFGRARLCKFWGFSFVCFFVLYHCHFL